MDGWSELLTILGVLGAMVAGALIRKGIRDRQRKEELDKIEEIVTKAYKNNE